MDYNLIQQAVDNFAFQVINEIKNEFSESFSEEQLDKINSLIDKKKFIIVESPNESDLKFFSEQEGITNQEKYDYKYVPSAHGGRTKGDDLIHIYPYAKDFGENPSTEEAIRVCIDDLIIHEIFHYFIRPGLTKEQEDDKTLDKFMHYITEGFVQLYAENFALNHGLASPKSNYDENVNSALEIISGLKEGKTQEQIDRIIFTSNLDQLLEASNTGLEVKQRFINELEYHKEISEYISACVKEIMANISDKDLKGILHHFEKIESHDALLEEFSNQLGTLNQSNIELYNQFISGISTINDKYSSTKEITRQ